LGAQISGLSLDVDFVIAKFMTGFGILSWSKEGAIKPPWLPIPMIMDKQITTAFGDCQSTSTFDGQTQLKLSGPGD
jgi:hypothetical protein